ncbi:MAG: HAD family hydrolase [Candidatus Promineifilaceae bacterium]|nr:HAD family hydrolase [Candidatus Promineifilaceae bacterium]
MPQVTAGSRQFNISAIVFDKDGTLIDFNRTWARRTAGWIEAMSAAASGNEAFAHEIARTTGYDWQNKRVLADGPIAVTTAEKLVALAAGELYKHGLPWHEAESLAIETAIATLGADFQAGEIISLGDVEGTFRRLKEAGLQVAIATGDDRKPTHEILAALRIEELVDVILCGDDPLPKKPDPAVLRWISDELGTIPARMLMVGDTVNDMLAGRNAGVAGCIGITGSIGDAAQLSPYADILLPDISGIKVNGQLTVGSG